MSGLPVYGAISYFQRMSNFQLAEANRVNLDPPKIWHIPSWHRLNPHQQMEILRKIVVQYERDQRLVALTVKILRAAKVEPRDYRGQAAALLKWVQDRVYYVNERGERLQTPDYTMQVMFGDCDDLAILLAALCSCIRLPYRFVLSGQQGDRKARWIEGTELPLDAIDFGHIYLLIGLHPYMPNPPWVFAEPTLKRKPLGWDVVAAASGELPEMGTVDGAGGAGAGGAAAGAITAAEEGGGVGMWDRVLTGVAVGVATTVLSSLLIEMLGVRRK